MQEPKRISDIELAKALAAMQGVFDSNKEFNEFINSLVNKEVQPRIHQIIQGLSQEDEFAVLCKTMGTCASISKIGQTPIVKNTDEKAPDFLASFHLGYSLAYINPQSSSKILNCFVEVKSCKKTNFSISSKDLKARQKFADRFKLPLLIAVRFTMFNDQTYWVIEEASKVAINNGKINITDAVDSIGSILFDDYLFTPHPHLRTVEYYEKTPTMKGLKNKTYGTLVRIELLLPGLPAYTIPANDTWLVCLFLIMFSPEKLDEKALDNNTTAVYYKIENQGRLVSDIAYSSNYLIKDENGNRTYNAGKFLARIDSDHSNAIITKYIVEVAASIINAKNVHFFRYGIGSEATQKEKIERLHNG